MSFVFVPDRLLIMDMIDDPDGKSSDCAKAFDFLIDMISVGCSEIVIPSQMADKLKRRFKEEHSTSFFSQVEVDYSTKDTEGYDSYNSYQWLVPKKAKNLKNIVIFVAKDPHIYTFEKTGQGNVCILNSTQFISKAEKILSIVDKIPFLDNYDDIMRNVFKQ